MEQGVSNSRTDVTPTKPNDVTTTNGDIPLHLQPNGATNTHHNTNHSNSVTSRNDDTASVTTATEAHPAITSERDLSVPLPPDGGWGWMVVLGSFIIHIIADGMAYSFGVVVVALLNDFEDVGREEMGIIGAIMVGLTMGVGKCNENTQNYTNRIEYDLCS